MSPAPAAKIAAIGAVNLRRFGRDRSNLFFVFVFPVALILIIGLQFGDEVQPRLGIVHTGAPLADQLVAEIAEAEPDVETVALDEVGDAQDRVESGDLDAAVVVPEGMSLEAPPEAGSTELGFISGTTQEGQQLESVVDSALARLATVPLAVRAAVERGADPDDAADAADELAATVDGVEVRTVTAGDRLFPEGIGGYDVAAPSTLVLFVFVNGLAGSYALIQTRQYGVSTRMLSTPTSSRSIVAGEALGRLVIGVVQGVYILLATILLFDVGWGDPVGASAVLIALAAVSAGAAMCFGTFFSNPDQASGIGVVVALALGALGGAMLPIELFGDTLADVARVTPHFWAIDAFAELVRHDGSIADIAPQLAVLTAYAGALILLAAWRMRIVLTRSA